MRDTKFFGLENKFYIKLLFTLILICFSSSKSQEKGPVLRSGSEAFEYVVFQETSKINGQDVDQCEKYLEIKSGGEKTEIFGADIADLFSYVYDVDKNTVKLLGREPIFYQVSFKGNNRSEAFRKILNELLELRKVQVKKFTERKEVFYLPIQSIKSAKLALVKSNAQKLGASVLNQNGMIILKNSTPKILIQTLNSNFANSFYYEPVDENDFLFDLEFPAGKTLEDIISYIENNYQHKFAK